MQIEIKAPTLPESISDATVVNWHKHPGETVTRDETLVDIETEKVMLEVPAPRDGVLKQVIKDDGSTVTSNELIAVIEVIEPAASDRTQPKKGNGDGDNQPWNLSEEPAAAPRLSPAARHLVREHELDASIIPGTGKGGLITKQDVMNFLNTSSETATAPAAEPVTPVAVESAPRDRREPMSRLRATIAERLVESQHNAALLSTFNEIDMHAVLELRREHQARFEKRHGTRLGLMSFFVKAAAQALQRFPIVNASVDGTNIVYHDYYDIGIAVSSPRGLVVPVLRNAERMSFAGIETAIAEFAARAREGSLTLEELTGGTFTITDGGVFGSMLSTPIVNPPQSAILAMHKIVERPVAVNGEVCIRPVMYVALTYDHRIIDGRDAVEFLVAIKEALEDPAVMMLEI